LNQDNKKKGLRFWLLFATLFGLGFFVVLLLIYIINSSVSLPLKISVSGIDQKEMPSIRFIGEKPIFGEYEIPGSDGHWQGEAAFYKNIRTELPATLSIDSILITIENRGAFFYYSFRNLNPISGAKIGTQAYYFSPPLSNSGSLWQKTSILVTKPEIQYVLFSFFVLFLLIVVMNKLKFLITVFRKLRIKVSIFTDSLMLHEKKLLFSCLIASSVISIIFCLSVRLTDRAGTLNLPDTYDYQSIAVNFTTGKGFPVSGIIQNVESYKFDSMGPESMMKLEQTAGFESLHRAPVFGLFCGIVYKIFGIHPIIIKYFLLVLLCFIGMFMVYMGTTMLGKKGFWAGLISGLAFIFLNVHSANEFVPGSIFISTWVVLSFYVGYSYFKKPGIWKILILAFIFSSSWLAGFSLMLIPFFILGWLIILAIKNKSRKTFLHACAFVMTMIVVVLPWQIYANYELDLWTPRLEKVKALALDITKTPAEKRTEANEILPLIGVKLIPDSNLNAQEITELNTNVLPKTRQNGFYPNPAYSAGIDKVAFLEDIFNSPDIIFLFLQKPNHELLSCHNELMKSGMIQQDWRIKDCYYMRQDTSMKSEIMRVLDFYSHNPAKIFSLSKDKICAAFGSYKELLAVLAFWLGLLFLKIKRTGKAFQIAQIVTAVVIPFVILLALSLSPWFYAVMLVIFVCSLFLYPRLIPSSVFERLSGLYFLNYIFTVIIAFGIDRYIQPLQFLMLFMAVYMVFLFIGRVSELLKTRTI
jgi:hypothetical protein